MLVSERARNAYNSLIMTSIKAIHDPDASNGDITAYTLNTESTYDWIAEQWSVSVNFQISKLTKFGNQPVSLQAGVKYWAESPDSGAHGWGGRLALTFILP
jgi:hypothetical protein